MPTAKDARTLWCPFARARDTQEDRPAAVNRTWQGAADRSCLCLATDCMAWRWDNPHASARPDTIPYKSSTSLPLAEEPPRTGVPESWRWFPGVDWGVYVGATHSRVEPHWQEPEDEAKARFEETRSGHCGAAG